MVGPDVESDVNDIQNPTDIRNKGCGSRGKRLKSTKEMIDTTYIFSYKTISNLQSEV